MAKSIRQQIKEQPRLHYNLFTCWLFAIVFLCIGEIEGSLIFSAISMTISAIIDKNNE